MASKVEQQIAKLKPLRTVAINQIGRIDEFIKATGSEATKEELTVRLDALESSFKNFETAQSQLEYLDGEELANGMRSDTEEIYYSVKPKIQVLLSKFKRTCVSAHVTPKGENNFVKLPKCEITPFDGDRKKWITFYESFSKLIHSNTSLSDIARFGYLRQLVKHPASQTIESLELTAENYVEALKLLEDRYSNKKLICEDHIREIFSIKQIDKPSAEKIRALIDSINSNLRALNSLQRPTEQWDDLIVFMIRTKLDGETRSKWDDVAPTDRLESLEELITFLNKRCHSLENTLLSNSTSHNKSSTKFAQPNRKPFQNTALTSLSYQHLPCSFCKINGHRIYNCRKFVKMSPEERASIVSQLQLCVNCLRNDHSISSCSSQFKCSVCKQPHHTLIHQSSFHSNASKPLNEFSALHTTESAACSANQTQFQNVNQPQQSFHSHQNSDVHINAQTMPAHPCNSNLNDLYSSSTKITSQANTTLHTCASSHSTSCQSIKHSYVFLGTARIQVMDKSGKFVTGRALLDSGSQLHFVTSEFATKLGLKRHKSHSTINSVGETTTQTNTKINMKISSFTSTFNAFIEAYILPTITDYHPAIPIDISSWNIPKNIKLADDFFAQPQQVDILIGAELYLSLLSIGQIKIAPDLPRLQNTLLGWIVSGTASHVQPQSSFTCNLATLNNTPKIEDLLQKFWTIETVDDFNSNLTSMEVQCEDHFKKHTYRTQTGRFVVTLPLANSPTTLGDSRTMAIRRFLNIEKRLERDPDLKTAYQNFMNEYIQLHHMVPVSDEEIATVHYYLPHHCVVKQQSSSTKLRVVFDASAKTDSGLSLNNLMMVGPVVQSDLFSILLRFRKHRYVMSADVTKMYRQILVNEPDTHLQYIIWRNNHNDKLQTYRLTTVTYGTAAAPYLATKCISTLAQDNSELYPDACQALHYDVYVDDLLTGADTIEKLKSMKHDVVEILDGAGMELRKWCSNNEEIINDVAESDREPSLNIDDDNIVKTLGLLWLPDDDNFRFFVPDVEVHRTITKRTILSEIARIFDPLGFTGPVIIVGKMLMKRLWELQLDWDEAVPQDVYTHWHKFRSELNLLNNIRIPRRSIHTSSINVQIHGFADASESAYGAAIYARNPFKNGTHQTYLLCAKSRVAPSKKLTIPRLELCAAELLAQLMSRVDEILDVSPNNFFFWTDSTIVLQWINSESSHFKTFVANRVSRIQQLSKSGSWYHISTKENPADLISRGMSPSQLATSLLWFHGPEFLVHSEDNWNDSVKSFVGDSSLLELKSKVVLLTTTNSEYDELIQGIKYKNSYRSLINVMSFVLRFVDKSRRRSSSTSLTLSEMERDNALYATVKMVQKTAFSEELRLLNKGQSVNKDSHLKSLSIFLDEKQVIRVGGRLFNSSLPYSSKFPILLPSSHSFTNTVFSFYHKRYFHAAPQALLAAVREKFWPLNGRKLASKVFNNCITCTRVRPKSIIQSMGNLPQARTSMVPPFYNVGIDYCGPFYVHYKIRGKKPTKAYICVFICFTVKAIHLELVTEMTTAAFIGALKRFVSTRGLCKNIWSDNGSNFVGANNLLNDLYNLFMSQDHKNDINKLCEDDNIVWHFAPPYSPHFGGMYEAAVKSTKYHLRRIVGNASLTFEEMNTVIKQVEAILNSRPLTPLSNNPNDLQALTPGHFLIGRPLMFLVEPNIVESNIDHSKRWHLVQQLVAHFWKRWSSEYLTELQQRKCWTDTPRTLTVGDIVLIKDDNLPPMKWKTARITKLKPGTDGVVRVVELKTQYNTTERAVTRICPLYSESVNLLNDVSFKAGENVEAKT